MARSVRVFCASFAALLLGACDDPTTPGPAPETPLPDVAAVTLGLDTVATGLPNAVFLTAPRRDARLFVVQLGGWIRIIHNGAIRPRPFLDVSDLVSTDGARGLLGLAFHPDFETNGRFFVDYTDADGDIVVVEYGLAARNLADPASARLVLEIPHDNTTHHGGTLAFGDDGYLYISVGDGGAGQRANGQNLGVLLGKVLRIDVDGALPYAIPTDNPFVDSAGARPEIWHYGLRNPYRMSFDRANGRLYIGDVGAQAWEEVNRGLPGRGGINFGWAVTEGSECFPRDPCDKSGIRTPIFAYDHTTGACSITAGYVYRGRDIPELRGRYFFGDFCSGVVSSFAFAAGDPTDLQAHDAAIGLLPHLTAIGEDSRGELYLVQISGDIYRLIAR